jgi:hypothetical protein
MVMHSDPERDWRVPEILAELDRRGWLPDATDARRALDATLHRLAVGTNQIDRVGRGAYRLPRARPVRQATRSQRPREEE